MKKETQDAYRARGFALQQKFGPAISETARPGRRSELVPEYAEDQVLEWEDVDWRKQLIAVYFEKALPAPRPVTPIRGCLAFLARSLWHCHSFAACVN
jgi:hypothetical protein